MMSHKLYGVANSLAAWLFVYQGIYAMNKQTIKNQHKGSFGLGRDRTKCHATFIKLDLNERGPS